MLGGFVAYWLCVVDVTVADCLLFCDYLLLCLLLVCCAAAFTLCVDCIMMLVVLVWWLR